MQFKKGDRVLHPKKPDWGIGEVLENTEGQRVKVFFVEAGEKKISLELANLSKIDKEPHPILDNLRINMKKHKGLKCLTGEFLKEFPDGFGSKKYHEKERNYKLEACQLLLDTLSQSDFSALLDQQNYDEICKLALKIVNKINLVYPNEKMSLKDGLKDEPNKKLFGEQLYSLLYGNETIEIRFNGFISCLKEIDAAKWTTATYFLFLAFPEKHMFLKPEVTKQATEAFSFELNYKSEVNWSTYQALLKFSNYLMEELSYLNPKDMIDIQSFIWCAPAIANGEYK